MSETVVLGVDGGSTKTLCVVADGEANVLGRGRSGSSNANSVGVATAQRHLEEAIQKALRAAARSLDQVAAVCIGASGVDRPDERARILDWLRTLLPDASALIYNDAVVALASGTGGIVRGIVLISGTGMIVYGFDGEGRRYRAGGWGALLGDGGSGYAIGAAILKAVTWAADGRGPATSLQPALLNHLDLAQPQDLVAWTYRDTSWDRFARLAPLATACAQDGDVVAQEILAQAAADLAVAVEAVVEKLAWRMASFPLVLSGGVLQSGPLVDALQRRLHIVAPNAQIVRPQVEPAVGAAWLALRHLSTESDPETYGPEAG